MGKLKNSVRMRVMDLGRSDSIELSYGTKFQIYILNMNIKGMEVPCMTKKVILKIALMVLTTLFSIVQFVYKADESLMISNSDDE